jgi:uncharacterized protein (TIGR03382 family)
MKHRLGLLICGIFLIAAVPVWADKGPNPGSNKDFGKDGPVFSGSSNLGLNAGGASVLGLHSDSVGGVDSGKIGVAPSTNWRNSSRYTNFGEIPGNPPAMAEPGTISLALLGLVSVGLMMRRRDERPTSV